MSVGVGVIGAGIVGGGVIDTLLSHNGAIRDKAGVSIELRHVAELNQALLTAWDFHGVRVSNSAEALIEDPEVQVVCELIGGIEPAKTFILSALNHGKHVVTANKRLLATHGTELNDAAIRNGVDLRFEAAVAGAIPIIKAIRESLAANHIQAVYGILNGTCNYILSRMTFEGLEFDDVLKQAQALGFAETPPDLDIQGHDTAHKCQILASLCHSTRVNLDDIYVEGITSINRLDVIYAREMGYQIKLLAVVRRAGDEIDVRVHPTLVPEGHLLASVRNEFNGIYVESDIADATLYYGRGAGRRPTASSVLADIIDIARCDGKVACPPFRYTHEVKLRDIGHCEGRYYLRFTTQDHPGELGRICTILGSRGVSIASCIQKQQKEHTPAHVVLMTHGTIESSVMDALREIDALDFIAEKTHVLRVL